MPLDGDLRSRPDLSRQQQKARDTISKWLRRGDDRIFRLEGYAGTGKTELITRLGRELPGVQYAAYTGKAASVFRQRGADNAATLHSLLYGPPIVRDDGELVWRCKDGRICADLVIADECSQIDCKLGRDLLKTGYARVVRRSFAGSKNWSEHQLPASVVRATPTKHRAC